MLSSDWRLVSTSTTLTVWVSSTLLRLRSRWFYIGAVSDHFKVWQSTAETNDVETGGQVEEHDAKNVCDVTESKKITMYAARRQNGRTPEAINVRWRGDESQVSLFRPLLSVQLCTTDGIAGHAETFWARYLPITGLGPRPGLWSSFMYRQYAWEFSEWKQLLIQIQNLCMCSIMYFW